MFLYPLCFGIYILINFNNTGNIRVRNSGILSFIWILRYIGFSVNNNCIKNTKISCICIQLSEDDWVEPFLISDWFIVSSGQSSVRKNYSVLNLLHKENIAIFLWLLLHVFGTDKIKICFDKFLHFLMFFFLNINFSFNSRF